MKLSLLLPAAALLAAFAPSSVFAQELDGSDIGKAIPIHFGQIVTDIGDVKSVPARIYSITLAKGQQVSGTLTIASSQPSAYIEIGLLPKDKKTIGGCYWNCNKGPLVKDDGFGKAVSFTYQVAVAGTYYVMVDFNSTGVSYSLQVTATGTPIAVPNPPTAGCLSGRVDYITYSLQLIAAGLPDELSIGGTKVSASSIVKPPLYPEIVTRLENALRSKVNVETCYDASGNIFQIKLVQP